MSEERDKPEIALEARGREEGRMFSPSAARNRDVIAQAFAQLMPTRGDILEIGSGTGEHGVRILEACPDLSWQPSDPDEDSRRSISAWKAHLGLSRLAEPIALDVTDTPWPFEAETFDGLVSCNMIHISPFATSQAVFSEGGRVLRPGGRLMLYGPFRREGKHTAPSNEAFDASLKSRNPDWGVRDLEEELLPLARAAGFGKPHIGEMPANNLTVVFTLGG